MSPTDTNTPRLASALTTLLQCVAIAVASLALQACAVLAVADAAVTVVATGVKVTAKAIGAVADVIIPNSEDD